MTPHEAVSFKVFNLLLHFTNGALVYFWLKRVFSKNLPLVLLTTALFLIHPLQNESVTYVMGRVSLIQAFFYLSALLFHSCYRMTKPFTLSLLIVSSLLAKETCVFIPVLLLFQELTLHEQPIRTLDLKKWTLVFLSAFLIVPLWLILKDPLSMYASTTGFHLYPMRDYFFSQLYFQFFYLELFLNPRLQSLLHAFPSFQTKEIIFAVLGGVFWTTLFALLVTQFKKNKNLSFFIFFYLISYFPTGSLLQLINPFSEYRLYLSNLMLCLGFAHLSLLFTSWLSQKNAFQRLAKLTPLVVILYFGISLFGQAHLWRDGVLIYMNSVRHYPSEPNAYRNLGVEYLRRNQLKDAIFCFSEVRFFSGWLDDQLALNEYWVAVGYYQQGKYKEAAQIIKSMEADKGKDPLPPPFFELKEAVFAKLPLPVESQER